MIHVLFNFQNLRTDEAFNRSWNRCQEVIRDLDLQPCKSPRPRKIPRRLEQTDRPCASADCTSIAFFKRQYFELIDVVVNRLKVRTLCINVCLVKTIICSAADNAISHLMVSSND